MSPQGVEMGPLGAFATEKTFARPNMLSILDPKLSDGSFRLLCMLSGSTWKSGKIDLSFPEIGSARSGTERTAQRQVAELVRAGLIRVTRRHNHRNEYEVIGGASVSDKRPERSANPVEDAEPCPSCNRGLKMTKRGICVACCRDANKVEAWIVAKGELGPGASKVDIAARVVANKAVKSHRQAAKDADRLERRDAEWIA